MSNVQNGCKSLISLGHSVGQDVDMDKIRMSSLGGCRSGEGSVLGGRCGAGVFGDCGGREGPSWAFWPWMDRRVGMRSGYLER